MFSQAGSPLLVPAEPLRISACAHVCFLGSDEEALGTNDEQWNYPLALVTEIQPTQPEFPLRHLPVLSWRRSDGDIPQCSAVACIVVEDFALGLWCRDHTLEQLFAFCSQALLFCHLTLFLFTHQSAVTEHNVISSQVSAYSYSPVFTVRAFPLSVW